MKHKNSKEVTIFRAGSFLARAQGKEVDDFFASSHKTIGSYWESKTSKRVGTGLDLREIKLLLVEILEVTPDDRDWQKEVNKFYHEISTSVPYGTGVTLEIGLEKSNDVVMGKENMPLNIMDYIRYRHAQLHPQVAQDKDEADGNATKEFYIFDKYAVIERNKKVNENKDTALSLYLEIKEDENKVNTMLTLLGIDPREFEAVPSQAISLKQNSLKQQAEKAPEKFVSVYQTGDLEERYWVQTMINTKILKLVGTKYVIAETNKLLANSLDEAIFYFKDELNSDMIVLLKAKMQETLKAKNN